MNLYVKIKDFKTHITDGISDCPVVEILWMIRNGPPDSQLAHVVLLVFHLRRKCKDS